MSFRFDPNETVREALERCASEQLVSAAAQLTEGVEGDPVKAVHGARKAIKKERALLRMARGTIAPSARRRENGALRDAARRVSGARDAEVMVQALDELSERYAGQLPDAAFDAFRAPLSAERDRARARVTDPARGTAVADELSAVGRRLARASLSRGGWQAIGGGLVLTYRRGRQAFRQAGAEPSAANLHQWRKRTKDLWYQLRLVAPVCGQSVHGQAKEAHALSDLLGDDHDLAVLRDTLIGIGSEVPADLDGVLGLLDHRREHLQAQAMFVGARVYAEKPKAFGRRLHRCWGAGRGYTRAVRRRDPGELSEATRPVAVA